MTFSDEETHRIKEALDSFILKRRPSEKIRDQVDLSYKIDGRSVEIFEIRKIFQKDEKIDVPIAKATYVLKDKVWKVYWQRADLKWHAYEPSKQVKKINSFVKIVDEDKYGCFWG